MNSKNTNTCLQASVTKQPKQPETTRKQPETNTMSITDMVTFTERLMEDAASDVHRLIDDVDKLEEKVTVRDHKIELLFDTIAQLIKTLFGEMVTNGCEFVDVGDDYTLQIPSGGVRLAKSIMKCGIKSGVFAKARYAYTLCENGVHIKLEALE